MTNVKGPFWVIFESNLGLAGVGELYFRDGVFWGSDDGYRYRGFLEKSGGCYFGRAVVTRINSEAVSIFGTVERFELVLSGRFENGDLQFSGCVLGAEHLRLRFRVERQVRHAAE